MSNPIQPHDSWKILDSTKITSFMTCPRKFFFEYILGWRSEMPNNHLHFGTCFHLGMEHILKNGLTTEAAEQATIIFLDAYRKETPPDQDEVYHPKTPTMAYSAYMEYVRVYRNDRFELLLSEIAGALTIDAGVDIYFRMDAILRNEAGRIVGMDHKTSSTAPGYFRKLWHDDFDLSFQMHTYQALLNACYGQDENEGVIVNGVFLLKKSAIDFERINFRKSPDMLNAWAWEASLMVAMIRANIERAMNCSDDDTVFRAFPRNTQSCTKYGGCQFKGFCLGWANPLRRVEEPPVGWKVEFWDPTKEQHKVELNAKHKEELV